MWLLHSCCSWFIVIVTIRNFQLLFLLFSKFISVNNSSVFSSSFSSPTTINSSFSRRRSCATWLVLEIQLFYCYHKLHQIPNCVKLFVCGNIAGNTTLLAKLFLMCHQYNQIIVEQKMEEQLWSVCQHQKMEHASNYQHCNQNMPLISKTSFQLTIDSVLTSYHFGNSIILILISNHLVSGGARLPLLPISIDKIFF